MEPVNLDAEEKLMINALLFYELRGRASIDNKLRNVEKHLAEGADVNASDANDRNDTPLHIAVKKDQPDIVKYLLQKGANPYAKNNSKQSPLDLARLSTNRNKNTLIEILEASTNRDCFKSSGTISFRSRFVSKCMKIHSEWKERSRFVWNILLFCKDFVLRFRKSNKNETSLCARPKIAFSEKKLQTPYTIESKDKEKSVTNQSRSGTAGINGQLYETKLLGLLLLRALSDKDIDKFLIGTNIPGIGAFDDIVFKYFLNNESNPKIFFLQAKHRDDPAKDKITVNNVLKTNNDFSLGKYFESYLKIAKKFNQKSENVMFQYQSDFHTLDCSFIIYTPANEDFQKKKLIELPGKETLLSTSKYGKTFMYDYDDDDVEVLLKNTLLLKTSLLAKAFAKNIVRGNYKNIMLDELVKEYHVFLAQHVLLISSTESDAFLKASFRKSFLESTNEIFVLLKVTMFKLLKLHGFVTSNEVDFEFELPNGFGNFKVMVNDEEYIHVCRVIKRLIKIAKQSDNMSTIKIDDSMIYPDKEIKDESDFKFSKSEMILLGKFVGDTLIYDEDTGLLKFNNEQSSLTENTRRIFEILKANFNIGSNFNSFKFEINVQNFPQMLCNGKHQREEVKDFLNKLKFYTDQAREDGVEIILETEISKRYNSENKNNDRLYHIKGDAMYVKYHDKIHKWWKHHHKQYLDESCTYYEEAKHDILDSPLINIFSYIYIEKINRFKINFLDKAVDILRLKEFVKISNAKVFHIITRDEILTSIKVIQYFKKHLGLMNYKFINLDPSTSEDHSKIILSELSEAMMDVIIIVLTHANNVTDFFKTAVVKQFKKKIIVISHSNILPEVLKTNVKCLEQIHQNTSLSDLDTNTKRMIVERKEILFQGTKVPFVSIVDENMQHLVKENVLHKIMDNEVVKIGKELTNIGEYYENKELYVNRHLCRCLKLSGERYRIDFNVVDDNNIANINESNKDILIISNNNTVFKETCRKHSNLNVHWFRRDGNILLWKKSYGSLQNIIPLVVRCEKVNCSCSIEPRSLYDLTDRVVVIGAEPGMGKSTLLTHLMLQTKISDKSMCVIKINMLDLSNEFSAWQECRAEFNINGSLLVLYKSFTTYKTNLLTINDVLGIVNSNFRVDFNCDVTVNKERELALFEFHCFFKLYNEGKIRLLFDGFDEICPHFKKEAIEFFLLLISSKVQRLWITSRSYMILNELESELGTFSYKLKGFSHNEQIGFLAKYWTKHLSSSPVSHYTSSSADRSPQLDIGLPHTIPRHTGLSHLHTLTSCDPYNAGPSRGRPFYTPPSDLKSPPEISYTPTVVVGSCSYIAAPLQLANSSNDFGSSTDRLISDLITPSNFSDYIHIIHSNRHVYDNLMLYVNFTSKIRDHGNEFTGTPLHLRMIAEVCVEYFKNSIRYSRKVTTIKELDEATNLIMLYEKFIDIKFYKIRFGEKKSDLSSKDPDIKMMIETERNLFIDNHKKLAAHSLLEGSNEAGVITEEDLKLINDLIQRFNEGKEKTGIIEMITQNKAKFVHFTYAEYFACEYLCDKLKQNICINLVCKYLVNHVLVMDNGGIRGFIDAKLEKDEILSNLTSKSMCDALLIQSHHTVPFRSAISLAIIEKRFYIAHFILKNIHKYINTNALDDFIDLVSEHFVTSTICQDYHDSRNQILMIQIVEIIKRFDYKKLVKLFFCNDIPIYNMFMAIFLHRDTGGKKCESDLVLKHLGGDELTKLFVTPLLGTTHAKSIMHILMQDNKDSSALQYLEKLNNEQLMLVFTARDGAKRVPAHYAAIEDNHGFFELMESLVGNERFRTICRITDQWGLLPLLGLKAFGKCHVCLLLFTKAGYEFRTRGREEGGGWYLCDLENQTCVASFYPSLPF